MYQAGFISILLSLLYNSSHTFISVTLSSLIGDQLALQYEDLFFFVVLLLSYFTIKKIITYFHLEMTYFDKDYLYPFLKCTICIYLPTYSIFYFRYREYFSQSKQFWKYFINYSFYLFFVNLICNEFSQSSS